MCECSVTSLPSSYFALFACDRQYDCIVRRYTHDSPGRYTPRSLADAETNTRRARHIGILTVVGFRILVLRVEVGLDLETQRARGRQALPGNSIQQQSAIRYDLQYLRYQSIT